MKLFRSNKGAGREQAAQEETAAKEAVDISAPHIPEEAPQQADQDERDERAERDKRELTEADFLLVYEPEGVFLSIAGGRPLRVSEQERLVRYLSRKKVKLLDMEKVLPALNGSGVERLWIAPQQEELTYDEAYVLTLSADMMEAYVTLSAPEPGKGKRLSAEQVLDELARRSQITYGLDREGFSAFLAAPVYDEPFVIARGLPPTPGEDGRLDWHIERRDGITTYKLHAVKEDEQVDFKNLDLFDQVKQDQLLVTRVPPKEGKPGRTVLGRESPAAPGKNYLLPQGKNTYITKDGLELRAALAGRVDEVNGHLIVSNVYHIAGDVDLSVGNIDFDGDVVVDGNVISGFTIKASGSIEVKGIVEGSALEAGSDILIRGGIQGGGKGMLQAQEGIYVRFAEYATLQAGTIVSAESLLHSNVSCLGSVEVVDGRGSIIGGNVCAASYIAARFLGNSSGRATDLQVGLSPKSRVRLAELEKMTFSLKKVVDRLQIILQENPDAPPKGQREQEARIENVRKLLQYKKLMLDYEAELAELKESMDGKKNGEVHAMQTAYPGICITIGLAKNRLTQAVDYATFRRVEGNIEFTNCRFRPELSRIRKRRR